ncbi:glyoxalase [Chitinophaga caeni]|uniref:Glyoxalase n=1 Tax=Chitinophaga caeni TaxID=2029983 RepID=A0A291QRS3_9BACT|nr:VOC family protein [Chitinophaga caeni]ATL46626.1 glyoxalase [Chitinophaga caeni]
MIQFERIHHVQLCIPIDAEDQAREFYGTILGLQEIERPLSLQDRPGMWFKMGNIELHIGLEESSLSKRHPAFEVKDIEFTRAYCISKGIKVKDEIPIPGQTRFSIWDPFENRIELLERWK